MIVLRADDRNNDELRPIKITRDYIKYAEGSTLIETGDTRVICTASVEDSQPPFLRSGTSGWVTAEYSMLPRSTQERSIRDIARRRLSGRTQEIQRTIGRSFRSVVDLQKLGERTIWIDCDVIQADGGTRTASITGGFVALVDAVDHLLENNIIKKSPVNSMMAATSVGLVDDREVLDLCFAEDSKAIVDMNVVMTEEEKIIEIQGTGEEHPFSLDKMDTMIDMARKGIGELIEFQRQALGDVVDRVIPDSAEN